MSQKKNARQSLESVGCFRGKLHGTPLGGKQGYQAYPSGPFSTSAQTIARLHLKNGRSKTPSHIGFKCKKV
jgi:hypothetical protein